MLISLYSSSLKALGSNPQGEIYEPFMGLKSQSGVNSSPAGAAGQVVGKIKLDLTPQSSKTPPL